MSRMSTQISMLLAALICFSNGARAADNFLGLPAEKVDCQSGENVLHKIKDYDVTQFQPSVAWPNLDASLLLEISRAPVPVFFKNTPIADGFGGKVIGGVIKCADSTYAIVLTPEIDKAIYRHERQHAEDLSAGLDEKFEASLFETPELSINGRRYLVELMIESRGYAQHLLWVSDFNERQKILAQFYRSHLLKALQVLRDLDPADSREILVSIHILLSPFPQSNSVAAEILHASKVFHLPEVDCEASLSFDLGRFRPD